MTSEKKDFKPKMAITMGDPRGIGPEIVAKAFARAAPHDFCTPLVLGDAQVLSRTVQSMSLGLRVMEVGEEGLPDIQARVLPVFSLSNLSSGKGPGEIPPEESSRASFAYIERAARMALEGKVEAIATAPVSKEAIHGAGISFRGHTEYLAEISGTKEFVMMLAGERLKVALVTTHVPLEAVAKLLTDEKIFSVIGITARGLQEYFHLRPPRIAVAALNPHAGEGGLLGDEEVIISRAVQRARDLGFSVSGPLPADSLFHRVQMGEFDAVVCMYHDQGLIPLKLLHFDTAVNVTLGLPFVRTSVDHGVAYDIAGKGVANSRSMEEAIRLAARMARRKREIKIQEKEK
jgi:4-hydroxythreonine-4-phosphate dehydrogenase